MGKVWRIVPGERNKRREDILDDAWGGEFEMTEKQNGTEKKDPGFCTDMPFAGIMRKMIGNQETASCCSPEIMSQMMSMCCKTQEEKEETPKT